MNANIASAGGVGGNDAAKAASCSSTVGRDAPGLRSGGVYADASVDAAIAENTDAYWEP